MTGNHRTRRRRPIETADYLRMVARVMSAGGQRVADGNVDELRGLVALRDVLDEAIVDAVRGLRDAGHTWEDIGSATGTTRQAAVMKWGPKL